MKRKSYVGIVLHKDIKTKFEKDVLDYLSYHLITKNNLLNTATKEELEDYCLYYWGSVEWDESCVEVSSITNALSNISDEDKFYFIQIKERGSLDKNKEDVFKLKEAMKSLFFA